MDYKEIAYLLGCYAIVADGEINYFELSVINNFLTLPKDSEIYQERQKIFSNDDTKIPQEELIRNLGALRLNEEEKKDVLTLIARIGYADFYMDTKEWTLLNKVSKILKVDSTPIIETVETERDELISSNRLKWHESLWGKFEGITYNILGKNDKFTDHILGGYDFQNTLEDIGDEASVDLDRVTLIMNTINDELKACQEKINILSVQSSYHDPSIEKVLQTVWSIRKLFNDEIENSVRHNIELLEKKKRNMRFFTIAFMGRTKAGKSTLHKVVTQQDDDDIGIGKLRTTRYNRSWYWDRLRIVDTPGIGAPGGEADTVIAKSIIDEADMICYIVTSDSIQETEFDFFETIKERNKPLYIILNYKSNLSEGIRLKRFLKNPTAWKDCTGSQSIEGHFKRIEERLSGKYNMDAVKIIPLHLLAAQLYIENKANKEDAEKLQKGSNIDDFIRSVKKEIYETGCLKKSLSIIDGASYSIFEITNNIKKQYDTLKNDVQLLKNSYKELSYFLSTENERLHKDVVNLVNAYEKDLENRASSFSDDHYDDSNAGKAWQQDSVVCSKRQQFRQRLDNRIIDFKDKLKSKMEEVASDLQVNVKFMNTDQIAGESITNTRLGAGILGTIVAAGATFAIANFWNPAGWVVAVGGALLTGIASFFSSLFTSKSEKIRKAKEKMKSQLLNNIHSNISSIRNDTLNNVDKSIKEIKKIIDGTFQTYILSSEGLLAEIDNLLENCNNSGAAINSLVGFRILDFVGRNKVKDKKIKDMTNEFLRTNFPVVRDWQNQSLTYNYENSCSNKDKLKAEKATQMTIIFK